MKKYILIIFFFLCSFSTVSAAQLYILTEKTAFQKDDIFSASVYVDTAGTAINSIEGSVDFSPSVLSVESINIGGSVFSIWVEQPSFSNTSGKIFFNGGVPNPGYTGSRGLVARVVFRAKQSGNANIVPTATIYANDGLGTAVTPTAVSASVSVTPASSVKTEEQTITPVTISKPSSVLSPAVSSAEMPDPETWYAKKNAVFSWNVPNDVSTVKLLLGSFPNSQPTVSYAPPIGNKELTGIQDGVSYLHVGFVYTNGQSAVTHRKIKIDTVPPTNIQADVTTDASDSLFVNLNASDSLSGVGRYEIYHAGTQLLSLSAKEVQSAPVAVPQLPAGTQELEVRVFDVAGNMASRTVSVDMPKLKAPVVTLGSRTLEKGQEITLSGSTYTQGTVAIIISDPRDTEQEYITTADAQGSFVFTSPPVKHDGQYSVRVEVRRGGATSPSSAIMYVTVTKGKLAETSAGMIDNLLSMIILATLVSVLVIILFATYYHIQNTRKTVRKELSRTEEDIHRIFTLIKDDLKKTVRILGKTSHKKHLTEAEAELVASFDKDIEEAEIYLTKRLEKIEKEKI